MSDELDELEDELFHTELVEFHIDDVSLKLTFSNDVETKSEVIFLGNISSCSVSDECEAEEIEVGGPDWVFFAVPTIIGLGLIFLFFEPRKNDVFTDTIMYYLGFVCIAVGVFGSNLWSRKEMIMTKGSSRITVQKNSGRDFVLSIDSKHGARQLAGEIESAIKLHQQTSTATDNAVQSVAVSQQASPMPSMPSAVGGQYLVAIDKEQLGPYDVDQLQQMINQGSLQRDTLVWNQSMPKWMMACEAPELTGLFGPPPIPD